MKQTGTIAIFGYRSANKYINIYCSYPLKMVLKPKANGSVYKPKRKPSDKQVAKMLREFDERLASISHDDWVGYYYNIPICIKCDRFIKKGKVPYCNDCRKEVELLEKNKIGSVVHRCGYCGRVGHKINDCPQIYDWAYLRGESTEMSPSNMNAVLSPRGKMKKCVKGG